MATSCELIPPCVARESNVKFLVGNLNTGGCYMSRVKQVSKRKRLTKTAGMPALGAAGLGLSLVGSASASALPTADLPQSLNTTPNQRFVLDEEEMADVKSCHVPHLRQGKRHRQPDSGSARLRRMSWLWRRWWMSWLWWWLSWMSRLRCRLWLQRLRVRRLRRRLGRLGRLRRRGLLRIVGRLPLVLSRCIFSASIRMWLRAGEPAT